MDIALENVTKAYGETRVLKAFSHTFPEGTLTFITGRSGCGKTTLLRLIAGLETPDAGQILGVPREGIAMLFQEDRLQSQLCAAACLRSVLKKTPRREGDIRSALKALDLPADESQSVSAFSGGMRRRVALARALLFPSPLVLLDEPFKGLDEDPRSLAVAFARPLLRGRTTLLVTHDRKDLEAFEGAVLAMS